MIYFVINFKNQMSLRQTKLLAPNLNRPRQPNTARESLEPEKPFSEALSQNYPSNQQDRKRRASCERLFPGQKIELKQSKSLSKLPQVSAKDLLKSTYVLKDGLYGKSHQEGIKQLLVDHRAQKRCIKDKSRSQLPPSFVQSYVSRPLKGIGESRNESEEPEIQIYKSGVDGREIKFSKLKLLKIEKPKPSQKDFLGKFFVMPKDQSNVRSYFNLKSRADPRKKFIEIKDNPRFLAARDEINQSYNQRVEQIRTQKKIVIGSNGLTPQVNPKYIALSNSISTRYKKDQVSHKTSRLVSRINKAITKTDGGLSNDQNKEQIQIHMPEVTQIQQADEYQLYRRKVDPDWLPIDEYKDSINRQHFSPKELASGTSATLIALRANDMKDKMKLSNSSLAKQRSANNLLLSQFSSEKSLRHEESIQYLQKAIQRYSSFKSFADSHQSSTQCLKVHEQGRS